MGKNFNIKTIYSRASVIPEILKKKAITIHKGQEIVKTTLNRYMVGYKVGEFAFTRKNYKFPQKKKK